MRTHKKIAVLAIITIAFALGAAVMPAMADSGVSEGTFTMTNTAPVVGTINLCLENGDDAGSTMTPQVVYNVSMEITDLNQLDDLVTIDVVIQDTAYAWGSDTNVSRKVAYQWTPEGWAESSRPSETPGGNTWGVLDTAKCTVPSDLSATSDTWWLCFTPGKVAKEATWNITVTATDVALDHRNVLGSLSMQWYGEIEPKAVADQSFGFGDLGLGTNNDSVTNAPVDFNTTTNGNYKLTSGTENWAFGEYTVTLDTDGGALAAGTFALRNLGADTVASADYVPTSAGTITELSDETSNYLEVGNTVPVYLWLSTASAGIMPGEYAGTYTLTIANNG